MIKNFNSYEIENIFTKFINCDKLVTLPDPYIKVLFYIISHVRQNTIFKSSTDRRLEVLSKQLRGVFDSEKGLKPLRFRRS
jgi:hypothetical protein